MYLTGLITRNTKPVTPLPDCVIVPHFFIADFYAKLFCMKKIVILLLVLSPFVITGQNVGVGTTSPVTKLNVVGNGSSPAIPGGASGALLRLGISSNQEGIDFGKMGTSPFSGWVQAGFNGTSPDPLSLQPLGGNLGIGTISPSEKLDVNGSSGFNGTMKLQGLNLFEFGAGVVGKELNAGKVGYNAFGQSALTFVGAGTNATNRAVYFFAEGGTTMNGPLNIEGPLRVNGNSGTTGQLLTSNGTGDPTWTNGPFGNTVRFAASFTSDVTPITYTNVYTTIYNNSPADVTISTNTITINKTGLYHIEGFINGKATFTGTPSYLALTCDLFLDGTDFKLAVSEPFNRTSSTSFTYERPVHFSQDIYITAPAVVKAQASIGAIGDTSRSAEGVITGYLISE